MSVFHSNEKNESQYLERQEFRILLAVGFARFEFTGTFRFARILIWIGYRKSSFEICSSQKHSSDLQVLKLEYVSFKMVQISTLSKDFHPCGTTTMVESRLYLMNRTHASECDVLTDKVFLTHNENTHTHSVWITNARISILYLLQTISIQY